MPEKTPARRAFFAKNNFFLTGIPIFSIIRNVTFEIKGRANDYGIAQVPEV